LLVNPEQQQTCLSKGTVDSPLWKGFMDTMDQHYSKMVSEQEMRPGSLLQSLPDLHFFDFPHFCEHSYGKKKHKQSSQAAVWLMANFCSP